MTRVWDHWHRLSDVTLEWSWRDMKLSDVKITTTAIITLTVFCFILSTHHLAFNAMDWRKFLLKARNLIYYDINNSFNQVFLRLAYLKPFGIRGLVLRAPRKGTCGWNMSAGHYKFWFLSFGNDAARGCDCRVLSKLAYFRHGTASLYIELSLMLTYFVIR